MFRFATLALVILFASPVLAGPPRLGAYRFPEAKITCGKDCRDRVRLARTMDLVAAGKLVVCRYSEERAIWVRLAVGTGDQCWRVPIPQGRLTGWRR